MKKALVIKIFMLFVIANITNAQSSSDWENFSSNSMQNPPISVTIGGGFLLTGSFPTVSGTRVDQFVTQIYNQARSRMVYPTNNEELFLKILASTEDYTLRGIKLKRIDGTEIEIDLLRFRLSGNFEYNPYLQNDDVIIFPNYNEEYDFIEIDGAVNKATKFQFVEGDKLSDAIFFARGINEAYENVDKALISRLSYDGKSVNEIEIDISDEIELKRGDRIKVLAPQTMRKSYKVLVIGEVKNPGYVFITKDQTSIKEVIEKSGGFTEDASLKDAELLRNFNRQQVLRKHSIELKSKENISELQLDIDENYWQTLETLRMYRSYDLMYEDTLFFNIDNQLRLLEGEGRIDFTKLDSVDSFESNFKVKNGDVIIIPEKLEAVYVFGQVSSTGYYEFTPDKDYQYYIHKAGGLTNVAEGDTDKIFIIKGKTREWIVAEENPIIEPGDYLYVVRELPINIWYYIYRIGTIAGILGSVATLVLLFK